MLSTGTPTEPAQSIRAQITVRNLNIFMTAALTAFPPCILSIDIKEALLDSVAFGEMLSKVLGQLGKPLPFAISLYPAQGWCRADTDISQNRNKHHCELSNLLHFRKNGHGDALNGNLPPVLL